MYQIVYTSEAVVDFSAADLKKLLVGARLRNQEAGVTGMLVFHEGTFLQALEGKERAVVDIFDRIKNDRRHRNVTILHQGAGPLGRAFGDWAMGFADYTGAANILKGFVRFNEETKLPDLDSARAVELLTACSRERSINQA